MEFLENLDELDSCPPPGACEENGLIVHRFTESFPPSINDFRSWRFLNPGGDTGRFFEFLPDECERRSCSVYMDEQAARRRWQPKPGKNNRFSGMKLVRLRIRKTDGVIRKEKGGHCSWWVSVTFDPVNNGCEEVLA